MPPFHAALVPNRRSICRVQFVEMTSFLFLQGIKHPGILHDVWARDTQEGKERLIGFVVKLAVWNQSRINDVILSCRRLCGHGSKRRVPCWLVLFLQLFLPSKNANGWVLKNSL